MRYLFLYIIVSIALFSCSQQKKINTHFSTSINNNYSIHNEFEKYFDDCGVNGSIAIFNKENNQWILSDTTSVNHKSLPASSFKIINLLIALETKVIKDENEIIKWVSKIDTLKYGYRPEIYHDMSVKEAFENSAGWVFIELAKKIGKENYKRYLAESHYGNFDLSEKNDDFWNFGSFTISPINQVEFLKNLYEGNLPFSKRNLEIVKRVMITEQTDDFIIRAKTGWTRENNTNTGWWVGYLEANDSIYFFATRLLQDRKNNRNDFGSCRKEITKKIFNDLRFINTSNNSNFFKAIDHIPIAVNDLEKVKDVFKNEFNFTIKEGKLHEGINNFFVKFVDGTYLEFISPTDTLHSIGKYYTDFLRNRQGGTSLAISILDTELIKKKMNEKDIPFVYDNNRIWQTVEPENSDLFFIEYANKGWKDNPIHTTHTNTTNSLKATYVLTDNMEAEVLKYEALGIYEIRRGEFLETPYKLFKIGQSYLYLLDSTKSQKIKQLLNSEKIQGICGFDIKVNSIQQFNKLIKTKNEIDYIANKTIIYFKEYNMFMTFSE